MSTTVDLGKITASVTVGTTTTGAAGTNASVSNSGTTQDAVLNFTIPRGAQGVQGPQGSTGPAGPAGPTGPQGPMGDVAVITPEQQAAFTMYSVPGQNTDGPMTQKAVTDALVGSAIAYDNSQSGLASGNVQGAIDEVTKVTNKSATISNNNKSDLDISDENGNVIARFENGHVKVRNFDSSKVNIEVADAAYDLDIADENRNVILRLSGGHIKTKYFNSEDIIGNKTHWYGKKWYAYGTSLTNTSNEGKYAAFVEQYSGMIRTNKGISGGALVANRNIYNAIMNTTDGKTEADLITLECLANDASSPFGTVQDTDNTTFLGSLGLCIAYLQQNTTAQIVVMSSMRGRRNVANTQQFYPYDDEDYANKCMLMEKLCLMYGIHYINPNHAMGYYRKTDAYYVDNIHHTALGGKVFADYIWEKLKMIPLWLT